MKYFICTLAVFILASCQHSQTSDIKSSSKVDHIIVVYLENHSFYNLFSQFPGADNTFPATYRGQVDSKGRLYHFLPVVTERGKAVKPDPRFPRSLSNKPFLIDRFAQPSEKIPDPIHEFFTHIAQIDGGKMDKFVAYSGVGALAVGYYDMSKTSLWKYANEYTLADRFFQSSFGGSYINHQWLIAAQNPRYEEAPKSMKIILNADGTIKKSGVVSPDGYPVNTIQPRNFPYDPMEKEANKRLPPIEYKNIGDLLSEKNISWAWYAGGWNDVLAGKDHKDFQYHHQPFLYFKKYGPGTEGRRLHLKDEDDLFAQIKNNQLPQVALFKPVGDENAHPGYSDVSSGDEKVRKVVEAIQHSPYWEKTLIIVTFDEHGGFWDPIAPPKVDRWGPGSRIPAIFISPQVKNHFVDHTSYETVSILSYLEKRFDLPPLSERDAKANPLQNIFK